MTTDRKAKGRTELAGGHKSIAVTGLGIASRLGNDVVAACAAARAGLTRVREIPLRLINDPAEGDMVALTGHLVLEGFSGVARLAQLGAFGLRDLLARSPLSSSELARTGLVLALGSGFYVNAAEAVEDGETFGAKPPAESVATSVLKERLNTWLVRRLLDLSSTPVVGVEELIFDDHSAGALAVERACALIESGAVDRCIVGGIDSYCQDEQLEALLLLDVLKTPAMPVGLAPGEAAAFLLLEPSGRAAGRPDQAIVEAVAYSFDGEHCFSPDLPRCRALEQALGLLFTASPLARGCQLTVGTHNGTTASAGEWARALVRHPQLARALHWFPAMNFGDTGAAAQVVAACLAARAFARGYARSDSALLWASGPRGTRSALCLARS